jgi:hypothetical protein
MDCGQEVCPGSARNRPSSRRIFPGAIVPITSADIAFYRLYDGDLDGLGRSADRDAAINVSYWRRLEDLRQRAVIVARGNGSEAFRREFESNLAAHLADADALSEFRQIVAADLNRLEIAE